MFGAQEYRVYFLSGSAALSRDIQCADDARAIEQAVRLFPEGIVEVWHATRLVRRIDRKVAAEETSRNHITMTQAGLFP